MARLVLPAIAAAIVGCSNDTPTFRVRVDAAFVTGAAAQALQPDGRFAMADSLVNPPNEVNEAEARTIASLYVKAFASSLFGTWSELHGSDIDPRALKPCDRALYAINPYTSFSREVSELAKRTFGPHWVVPMCGANNRLQVVVSFSSLATEMTANPGSNGVRPWERGDFASDGIPGSVPEELYSPEAAASRAFHGTGKRIAQVPVLVLSPRPSAPVLVRWTVELEAPVKVTGKDSMTTRERLSLFVGFGQTLGVSGLLDRNAGAEVLLNWKDIDDKPFSVTLSPLAPAGVELVDVN